MNQTKIGSLISKYKTVFLFNKNLILSAIGGFFMSAYVSQIYTQFDKNEFANSLVSLATEYAVYIPLFSLLFYVDNRQKYLDPISGKKNNKQIMDDIKKTVFSLLGLRSYLFNYTSCYSVWIISSSRAKH